MIMHNSLDIWHVDVFTNQRFTGNAAAVVFGADGLSTETMQDIAREMNLSETVFLIRPQGDADYGLRTFTTRREIPFAVHPAIAAAHAFAEAYNDTGLSLRQECSAGIIPLQRRDDGWFATVPAATFIEPDPAVDPHALAAMLGLNRDDIVSSTPLIAATGPRWLLVELTGAGTLDRITPDMSAIAALTRPSPAVGMSVYVRHPQEGVAAELRTFAPAEGIYEDPVCGSCVGALAAILRKRDPAFAATPSHTFTQGRSIARPGRVAVHLDGPDIHVGGQAITAIRGRIDITNTDQISDKGAITWHA